MTSYDSDLGTVVEPYTQIKARQLGQLKQQRALTPGGALSHAGQANRPAAKAECPAGKRTRSRRLVGHARRPGSGPNSRLFATQRSTPAGICPREWLQEKPGAMVTLLPMCGRNGQFGEAGTAAHTGTWQIRRRDGCGAPSSAGAPRKIASAETLVSVRFGPAKVNVSILRAVASSSSMPGRSAGARWRARMANCEVQVRRSASVTLRSRRVHLSWCWACEIESEALPRGRALTLDKPTGMLL